MLVLHTYAGYVATVGENFKRIREGKKITQESICEALKYQRPSNVSLLETSTRLPKPSTIKKMAAALGCEPWELLENVETPHDALRRRSQHGQNRQTDAPKSNTAGARAVGSRTKDGGNALAKSLLPPAHAKTHPISDATSPAVRRAAADLVRLAGEAESTDDLVQPARAARAAGEHAPASRVVPPSGRTTSGKYRR